MKQRKILILLITILGIGGGYLLYRNGNIQDELPDIEQNREEKRTIVFDSIEKEIDHRDFDKIEKILERLNYRVETIDAIVTDYLEIDNEIYKIQKDSKGIVLDNKQADITEEDFDIIYDIISK